MTYLEIIEWIENHVKSITKDTYRNHIALDYYAWNGEKEWFGKDLISIVLEINNKELIK